MLARWWVLVIAVCLCWPDSRISAAFSAERLRARLQALVDAGTTPSIAAAVGRDGRILWSGAAGLADVGRKVAATAETPYSLASISKPFTATAVMVLSERKLVELGAPFDRYLGPLPRPGSPDARGVTVERLLRHQAGFPTHYQFFYDDERARPLPLAKRLECYGVQLAAPGARYNYSNLGYGVLGELVSGSAVSVMARPSRVMSSNHSA